MNGGNPMFALLVTVLILVGIALLVAAGIVLDIFTGLKVRRPAIPEGRFATGSNRLGYFTDGRKLFADMKKEIEKAEHHIHISFFIFKIDDVGQEWLDLLKKKAQEGVEVRLLVDRFNGSGLAKARWLLAESGVETGFTGSLRFPFTFYHLNRRNHRKITVIDGKVGYFGGFNVSREYIGNESGRGPWHDNHLKVEGESVRDLQQQFLDDWQEATGEPLSASALNDPKNYFPEPVKGPSQLTLLATGGKQIEDVFAEKLSAAQTSIVIGSPYFIPSRRLMHVLIDRLDHHVSVKILLPMKRDHPFVKPASFHYLKPLLEKGATLFHFYQGFYHAKLFVVDQRLCYLGTANFDQRSLFWCDELSGFTEDRQLIRDVLDQVNKEIREFSKEIDLDAINHRSVFERIKTTCSAWLSFFL